MTHPAVQVTWTHYNNFNEQLYIIYGAHLWADNGFGILFTSLQTRPFQLGNWTNTGEFLCSVVFSPA